MQVPVLMRFPVLGARGRRLCIACCLFFPLAAGALPRHAPVPGGVAVIALDASIGKAGPPAVHFQGKPQAVVRQGQRWVALVGIPLDTPPGRYAIDLTSEGSAAPALGFDVRRKDYPTQRLHFSDSRLVEPPPELAQRIAAEQQRLGELKRHFTADREPDTRFELPASGRLSSRFGLRRILNGNPRSPHAGLDVAVATGQPVRAPAPGTVLSVDDFYFTGRTVVIDHGQGLLTLYAHLSSVAVTPGQPLQRGDTIGESGASGRATGPHLHWGVILGGSSVDPQLFLYRP